MSIQGLPSKPNIPSAQAMKDDPTLSMKYQQDMADYNFILQNLKSAQDNENNTRSNISKSSDEALKNTIANLK